MDGMIGIHSQKHRGGSPQGTLRKPSKFTPDVREIILASVRDGATVKEAAGHAHVPDQLVWDWLRYGKLNAQCCEGIREEMDDRGKFYMDFCAAEALDMLNGRHAIRDPKTKNPQSRQWLLERRHKEWQKQPEPLGTIQHTGEIRVVHTDRWQEVNAAQGRVFDIEPEPPLLEEGREDR